MYGRGWVARVKLKLMGHEMINMIAKKKNISEFGLFGIRKSIKVTPVLHVKRQFYSAWRVALLLLMFSVAPDWAF